jgi:hypothetical protein
MRVLWSTCKASKCSHFLRLCRHGSRRDLCSCISPVSQNSKKCSTPVGRSLRRDDVMNRQVLLEKAGVPQALSHLLLTSEPRVQFRIISYKIRCGKNGTATGVSSNSFDFPLLIITPPLLRTHLSPPLEVCNRLTRQHIIIFAVFRLVLSSLKYHVAGYRVTKFLLPLQCFYYICRGHAVAYLVEALYYKPEGRGLDPRWGHCIFKLT